MNRLHRSLVLTILVPVFGLSIGGCWYAVAGVGAYAGYRFVDGEYKGVLKGDLAASIKATRAAFGDLEIREKSFNESDATTVLEGESTGGRGVTVKLESAGADATNVRVRVDTFGDESFSQLVVDKINAHL